VELFPDLVAVHSEGKLILINAAGTRLLGATSLEQLVGQADHWILSILMTGKRVAGRIKQMVEQGTQARLVEQKWLRLDGTVIDARSGGDRFDLPEQSGDTSRRTRHSPNASRPRQRCRKAKNVTVA